MKDDDGSRGRKDHKKDKKKKNKKRSGKRDSRDLSDDEASAHSRASDDRRHRKKRSKKPKKETKHHKRDQKELRSKILYDLGPIYDQSPAKHLTADDYFFFHKHLRLFVFRTEGAIFDELSSQETRRYFKDFIQKYNAGKLPTAYYEPILPRQALDECQTTRHKWGFSVSKELELLQNSVYEQTEQGVKQSTAKASSILDSDPSSKYQPSNRPMVGPARPPTNDGDTKEPSRKRSRFDRAGEREKLDFRERRLLEKKVIGERTHAANRDRDAVELTDDAVYGGDSTDFRRALEQEKRRNAARQDRKTSRIQELKEKEAQKQKEMIERLGLAKR